MWQFRQRLERCTYNQGTERGKEGCQHPPGAGRGKEGPSPADFTGSMTLLPPWFQNSGLKTVRRKFLFHSSPHQKKWARHLLHKACSSRVSDLRKWHPCLRWKTSPLTHYSLQRLIQKTSQWWHLYTEHPPLPTPPWEKRGEKQRKTKDKYVHSEEKLLGSKRMMLPTTWWVGGAISFSITLLSYFSLSDPSSLIFPSQLALCFLSFCINIFKAWEVFLWPYLSGQSLLVSPVSGCNWNTMTLLAVFPSWPQDVQHIQLNKLKTDSARQTLCQYFLLYLDLSFVSTTPPQFIMIFKLKNLGL